MSLLLSASVSVSLALCLYLHLSFSPSLSLSVSLYLFLAISVTISVSLYLLNSSYLPHIPFTDRNFWSLWFLLFYSFLRMPGTRYWVDVIKPQSVRCWRCWELKVKRKTAPIAESVRVMKHVISTISRHYVHVNLLSWNVSLVDSLVDMSKHFSSSTFARRSAKSAFCTIMPWWSSCFLFSLQFDLIYAFLCFPLLCALLCFFVCLFRWDAQGNRRNGESHENRL